MNHIRQWFDSPRGRRYSNAQLCDHARSFIEELLGPFSNNANGQATSGERIFAVPHTFDEWSTAAKIFNVVTEHKPTLIALVPISFNDTRHLVYTMIDRPIVIRPDQSIFVDRTDNQKHIPLDEPWMIMTLSRDQQKRDTFRAFEEAWTPSGEIIPLQYLDAYEGRDYPFYTRYMGRPRSIPLLGRAEDIAVTQPVTAHVIDMFPDSAFPAHPTSIEELIALDPTSTIRKYGRQAFMHVDRRSPAITAQTVDSVANGDGRILVSLDQNMTNTVHEVATTININGQIAETRSARTWMSFLIRASSKPSSEVISSVTTAVYFDCGASQTILPAAGWLAERLYRTEDVFTVQGSRELTGFASLRVVKSRVRFSFALPTMEGGLLYGQSYAWVCPDVSQPIIGNDLIAPLEGQIHLSSSSTKALSKFVTPLYPHLRVPISVVDNLADLIPLFPYALSIGNMHFAWSSTAPDKRSYTQWRSDMDDLSRKYHESNAVSCQLQDGSRAPGAPLDMQQSCLKVRRAVMHRP